METQRRRAQGAPTYQNTAIDKGKSPIEAQKIGKMILIHVAFFRKRRREKHEKRVKRHGGMQAKRQLQERKKTMEEETEEEKEKDDQSDEQSQFKKAKYRRWRIAYIGKERHPRVMVAKRKTEKGKRIANAKLHLIKDGEEKNETDFTYFSPNPNPEITDRDGAFYKKIRFDDPNEFVLNEELDKWKVSKDGKKKMKSRYKEQIKNRKAQEKAKREANKKKEQQQARAKKAQRRRAGRTLGTLPLNHLRLRNLIKASSKGLSRGKKRKSKRRK